MKELWTEQALFSHLTLNCDFDLGPSRTFIEECTPSNDGEHLCQIKLMIEFWAG